MTFLNICYPQTRLIKALTSVDSSRPNGRLSQNRKTGDIGELFLPENDFKTSSAVNFPKKHPDFGGLEMNQRHETQARMFFFICPSICELDTIQKLVLALKGYLCYKMITSQNVSSKAQIKNFFYFVEKLCSALKIFQFLYF